MDLSVIILNYKSKGLIKQQLARLRSYPPTVVTEIIVVDNNSDDGIGEWLSEEHPGVRFIPVKDNRGYAYGNNRGLEAATGRYSMILNPDIIIEGATMDAMVRFMDEHPAVGMAGPRLLDPDGSLQYSCARFPDWWLPVMRRVVSESRWGKRWHQWYFMLDWDHAEARPVDWLFGACLIVRSQAMRSAGLLDERFFLYLEDTDWCRRFWEKGFSVWYVPTVTVIHMHVRSSAVPLWVAAFNKSTWAHNISFLKYIVKYWGKPNPNAESAPPLSNG